MCIGSFNKIFTDSRHLLSRLIKEWLILITLYTATHTFGVIIWDNFLTISWEDYSLAKQATECFIVSWLCGSSLALNWKLFRLKHSPVNYLDLKYNSETTYALNCFFVVCRIIEITLILSAKSVSFSVESVDKEGTYIVYWTLSLSVAQQQCFLLAVFSEKS